MVNYAVKRGFYLLSLLMTSKVYGNLYISFFTGPLCKPLLVTCAPCLKIVMISAMAFLSKAGDKIPTRLMPQDNERVSEGLSIR